MWLQMAGFHSFFIYILLSNNPSYFLQPNFTVTFRRSSPRPAMALLHVCALWLHLRRTLGVKTNRSPGRATPQPDSVKDRALVRRQPPQTGGHFLGALLSFAQTQGGRAQGQLCGPPRLASEHHPKAATPASMPRSASTEPNGDTTLPQLKASTSRNSTLTQREPLKAKLFPTHNQIKNKK